MRAKNKKYRKQPLLLLTLSLVLLGLVSVGGTLAYLHDTSVEITNIFDKVTFEADTNETFDKATNVKSDIKVQYKGAGDAYVRVKLVSYRVDEKGNRIGGKAPIEGLNLINDWFERGGMYYCPDKVPNGTTSSVMADPIQLKAYTDADGGYQVIEVLSEAIQAEPAKAVQEAWGVAVENGKLVNQAPAADQQN